MQPIPFLTHLLFGLLLFCVSAAICRLMIRRVRIMDVPNARSSHSAPVPKSGGIGIVATFVIGIGLIYLFSDAAMIQESYFIGFAVSALLVAAISLYDDLKGASFVTTKLLSQTVAAVLVMAFGLIIHEMAIPWYGTLRFGIWGYPLTFLWILGLTNAFNFMDGIDGLAAGTAILTGTAFSFLCLLQGSSFVYLIAYTLIAGTLGFFVFNFPRARLFMGDVGSAFLGFSFATLAIIAALYDHAHTSLLVMPMLLFHFIFDTFYTFCRRLAAGQNVFEAHRTHLYQLFTQLGFSHRTVSLCHFAVSLVQAVGAWTMLQIPNSNRVLVFFPFLVFEIGYAWIVVRLARKKGIPF